jgi:hypothetical protein
VSSVAGEGVGGWLSHRRCWYGGVCWRLLFRFYSVATATGSYSYPYIPPRREHDEFNRVQGLPDPSYDTLICAGEAKRVLHLFLHDYDDEKILSFCAEEPMFVFTTDQDLWRQNKKILVGYVPHGKDLKIIWERGSKAERIIKLLKPARELATEDSLSFSFAGRTWNFYVINIPNNNIRQFQEHVRALPDLIP